MMLPNCTFPYRFDNATSLCASAAGLLGDAFTAYNLAFTWVAALLLFGFLRSWLFHLREEQWHFVGRPSTTIPLLCTIAQFLAIIEATNLHLLRWSTRTWASLGCDLFIPCAFSALLVYFDHARAWSQSSVPEVPASSSAMRALKNRSSQGIARRLCNGLGHAIPWALGLALSVTNAKTPTSVTEGVSYLYIVPFVLILAADMAFVAWTLRTAQDHRGLRRRLIGMCSVLVLTAVYLTMRGIPILLDGAGQSPRPVPGTFPFESMPVPVAKIVGSTLAFLHYGRPRIDTDACQRSRYLDPLTPAAAHVAVLGGLISSGFVVPTAEALETIFAMAATVVPALFIAALCAQLLRAGPLLERGEEDTHALIAQCKADLIRAQSIPIVVKQFFTGLFLVSLSLKMGPTRHDGNGSSAAIQALTVLVELESLLGWAQDHRLALSIGVLATYVLLFASFVLLRLAPVPRWFLKVTHTSWAIFYDLFLISATQFVMKGLKCSGANLVMNEQRCDLSYAHRETLMVGFTM
jgi:hypothetical protein